MDANISRPLFILLVLFTFYFLLDRKKNIFYDDFGSLHLCAAALFLNQGGCMRIFRVIFHAFLTKKELISQSLPLQCFIIRANTSEEAKIFSGTLLKSQCCMCAGYSLTKIEELKLYEIALRNLKGENNTTQYSEDFTFIPKKEYFFAATPEEAKEIASTRESFNHKWGGAMVDRGPTEVTE